jgi:hypothetical protein
MASAWFILFLVRPRRSCLGKVPDGTEPKPRPRPFDLAKEVQEIAREERKTLYS